MAVQAPDKSRPKIEKMFDEIAPTYDRLNHIFTLNKDLKWRKEIVKRLQDNKTSSDKILDIASGTGDMTIELLRLKTEKVYSVDISEEMLKIQRKKIKDKRLVLVKGEVLKLPFENNYFDIVTIAFGIRNFENPENSLIEIKRVMKHKGKLIILEMFKSGGILTSIFNIYFGKIMPYVGNKISHSKYAYNYLSNSVSNFFSVKDFCEICERFGFKKKYLKNNFLGVVNTVYFTNDNS